jgi:hypothetical protein
VTLLGLFLLSSVVIGIVSVRLWRFPAVHPVPGSFFLFNEASRNLTVAMVPVILAALISLEFLVREVLAHEAKDDS